MTVSRCDAIFSKLLDIVELSPYDADPKDVSQLFFVLWTNESFPAWLSEHVSDMDSLYACISDIVVKDYAPSRKCIQMINKFVKIIENNSLRSDLKSLPANASMADLLTMFIKVMLHNTMWEIYSRDELISIHNAMFECLEFKTSNVVSYLPADPRNIVKAKKPVAWKDRDMNATVSVDAMNAFNHFLTPAKQIKPDDKMPTLVTRFFDIVRSKRMMHYGRTTRKLIRNHLLSFIAPDGLRLVAVEGLLDIVHAKIKGKFSEAEYELIMKQSEIYVLEKLLKHSVADITKMIKDDTISSGLSDLVRKLVPKVTRKSHRRKM